MTTSVTGIIANALKQSDSLPRDNRVSLTAYKGESIGIELTIFNGDGTPFTETNYTIIAYVGTRLGERVLRVPVAGSTAGQNTNVTNFVLNLPRYIVPAGYVWELYLSYGDISEVQIMPTSSLLVTQGAR